MADQRIARITLDEHTVISRNADIEHERAVAVYDLISSNHFAPVGNHEGPYHVHLRVSENRLVLEISDTDESPLGAIHLSLAPFRRLIKDYFTVCESYYQAIRTAPPSQIEAIDMGRRSLHNEGSQRLIERLAGKAEIDFDTARRLFTLLCVLHIRG